MDNRKHRSTFSFVPVASTKISLSDRFDEQRKMHRTPPGSGNYEQMEWNSSRRVDYVEEYDRPHSASAQWRKPFKLVRPSPNRPIRSHPNAYQHREHVSVRYRLSIPRERYRWTHRKSPIPPGFRRPYHPRNMPFGPPFIYQHRRPVRSRIGYPNRFGFPGRNPHFGGNSYDHRQRRPNRKRWVNREKLDKELDQYMSQTRSYLDKQLDKYAQEAKAAAAANFSTASSTEDAQAQAAEMESLLLDMD